MLAPETILQGNYRITYVVDDQPDCVIYRAIDTREALRVLIAALPQLNEANGEETRLIAQQVASVQAPALLGLRDHFADGLTYYLVADDPGGHDLDRVARDRGGPLPEAEVLRHIDRLLTTLATLHNRKPQLLLGDMRASDLWASPEHDLSMAPFVLVRHFGGEPSPYRAPELAEPGTEPTTASDLYAIGAVSYQLLTGWSPPTSKMRLSGTPLNSPRTLNGQVSPLAEQLVLRALEMKPANRYHRAEEMRSALETVRLMAGRPLGATAPVAGVYSQAGTPSIVPVPVPVEASEAPLPNDPTNIYGPLPPAPPPVMGGASQQQPTMASVNPVAPPTARNQGNTCLIAAVAVLAVAAVGICITLAVLGWFLFSNGFAAVPFPFNPSGSGGIVATQPEATAAAETTPAAATTAVPTAEGSAIAAAATYTQTRSFTEDQVGAVTFSEDGDTLAVAVGNTIQIHDAASLEQRQVLEGHENEVSALVFAPAAAGGLLASGATDEPTIRLWDAARGEQLAELSGHEGWVRGLAFSPDGALLASGSVDGTVKIWDVAARKELATLAGHTDYVGNVAFSPDGSLIASASRDGTVRLWQAPSGVPVSDFTFTAPTDPNTSLPYWLTGVSFSADGRQLATGSTDNKVYVLETSSGRLERTLEGHQSWVIIRGVSYSPKGDLLATASLDGTVRLWSVRTGAERGVLSQQGLRLLGIAWSPDGEQIAASSDLAGGVRLWNVADQEIARTLTVGQGAVTSLSYASDGNALASGGANGTVKVQRLDEEGDFSLSGGAPTAQYMAFVSERSMVAISDAGELVQIDFSQQGQPQQLEGLEGVALSVAAAPRQKIVAAGNERGDVALWDLESDRVLHTLSGLRGPVYTISFSEDGRRVAAVVNEPDDAPQLAIWDVESGDLLAAFGGHSNQVTGIALRANGSLLASTSADGTLKLWNEEGREERSISAQDGQGWFSSVAFSPDGSLLVTGSLDGQVEFWNPDSGERVNAIALGQGSILALSFRPDGAQLAASTRDGGIVLLDAEG
jgi:WD40 repeat protein